MDRVHGVVHGPSPWGGPWTSVHVLNTSQGRIQNMDRVHGPGPWTTPNFQQEIAPVDMKIYLRSGYEQKHRLILIA